MKLFNKLPRVRHNQWTQSFPSDSSRNFTTCFTTTRTGKEFFQEPWDQEGDQGYNILNSQSPSQQPDFTSSWKKWVQKAKSIWSIWLLMILTERLQKKELTAKLNLPTQLLLYYAHCIIYLIYVLPNAKQQFSISFFFFCLLKAATCSEPNR